MKLTAIILLTASLQVTAKSISQTITLSGKNLPLTKVFSEIKNQTGYLVVSRIEFLEKAKPVTVFAVNQPLEDFIKEVLKEQPFTYKFEDKTISIIMKEGSTDLSQRALSLGNRTPPVEVTGKVTDEDGLPLKGVNVTVKETSTVVVTNDQGIFTLLDAPDTAILIFSFVGMKNVEIALADKLKLGDKLTIDVKMTANNVGLGEVVVIGYGSQSVRNVTGSISRVNMNKDRFLPNLNIAQSLHGKVAGVQFRHTGKAGETGPILVRGQRSLSGSSNPLIILDGTQFNGNLSDINPNDIESMEILKDASSAAIYGSRAANGVILITLREGKTEKPTIDINTFFGISDWSNKVKLLTPQRYQEKTLEMRRLLGLDHDPSKIRDYLAASERVNYDAGKTTDPWDAISQQGRTTAANISLSGKTDKTRYFLSGYFSDEHGLILGDKSKRISVRSNIKNKITDWLTISLNASFARRDLSGVEASINNAYFASPYGTYYHNDGEPTQTVVEGENNSANPLRPALLTENKEIYTNIFSTLNMLVDVPFIKGLQYKLNYSPNYRFIQNYNFTKPDKHLATNSTNASKYNQNDFDWVLENIVNYKKTLFKAHELDLTLLYGINHLGFESTTAVANDLSVNALGWNNLSLGNILTNQSFASEEDGVSSMFRLNYRFKETYMLTLTARRDGSSVFAANQKYSTFPSGAIAWLISNESFMDRVKFFDMLKLRVSHGAVGNQAIPRYSSLGLAGLTQYVYGDGGVTSVGVFPSSMANPDLKWETTVSTNIGLDFKIFSGRIGGAFEIYNMKTDDLLVTRSLPTMTGYSSIFTNLGEVNNKGVELTLNTINVQTTTFQWMTDFVFSSNKNKIVHLYNSDTDNDGKEDDDIGNLWFIGQPIRVFYDYVADGIYQNGDPLPPGIRAGDRRFKDIDKDGRITASSDKEIIGQAEPKVRWGLRNTLKYKNITLDVFVNGMQGWIGSFKWADPNGNFGGNAPDRALNQFDNEWWTPENKSSTNASLGYTNPLQANHYFTKNFVRIEDINLTFNFPKSMLSRLKLSNLAVTLSGRNLFTFSDWVGTDPEVDGITYPIPRTISIGINTSF